MIGRRILWAAAGSVLGFLLGLLVLFLGVPWPL